MRERVGRDAVPADTMEFYAYTGLGIGVGELIVLSAVFLRENGTLHSIQFLTHIPNPV